MDEAIFRLGNGIGVSLALILSSKWMLAAVGLPLLAMFAKKRRWLAIGIITLSMASADLVSVRIIKPLVGRVRPCRALQNVEAPAGCGPGQSFPSAHATNAFALATSAGLLMPSTWYWLMPVAVGVAWSRVSLGVHYPSDILAGALLGAALAFLIRWLLSKAATFFEAVTPSSTSE